MIRHICAMWQAHLPGIYVVITCEVDDAIACVLAHSCISVRSICSCRLTSVWPLFAIWPLYFSSNFILEYEIKLVKYVYITASPMVDASDFKWWIYIPTVSPWEIGHIWLVCELWWASLFWAQCEALFYKGVWKKEGKRLSVDNHLICLDVLPV